MACVKYAALALLLASCRGGAPQARPLRDFRGIIHCHSLHSHDSKGTYEEILAAAKAAGIDFVLMTDHPPKDDEARPLREGWNGVRDGVLFVRGAEYAGQHLLALGIREPARGDVRARIKAIHAQGGLAVISHPEEVTDWDAFAEADAIEVYNVHAAFKRRQRDPRFLSQVLKTLKEDPERGFEPLRELDPAIVAKWQELKKPGLAANDAHQNVNLFGLQLDPYPRAFRFVTTHVLAEELSERAVLDAIRRGRCYVRFEGGPEPTAPRGDGPRVESDSEGRPRVIRNAHPPP